MPKCCLLVPKCIALRACEIQQAAAYMRVLDNHTTRGSFFKKIVIPFQNAWFIPHGKCGVCVA